MNLLKRYLAKEIISSILLITLGLLAMFSFFDLIQELENIGKGTYGIGQVLIFVLLSAVVPTLLFLSAGLFMLFWVERR